MTSRIKSESPKIMKSARQRKSLRVKLFQSRRSDSAPAGSECACVSLKEFNMKSSTNTADDSGIESTSDLKSPSIPSVVYQQQNEGFKTNKAVFNSVPPSPGGRVVSNIVHNSQQNNLLVIPQVSSFVNLSPRTIKRSMSNQGPLHTSSASPRMLRRPQSVNLGSDYYGDSISVINVSDEPTEENETEGHRALTKFMSGMYAVFILLLGSIIYINDQVVNNKIYSEAFSSFLCGVGIVWVLIFHVDLCSYKGEVLKQLKEREDAMQEASDRFSTATEFIINSGFDFTTAQTAIDGKPPKRPRYRFLMGRHSGSFYLKIGSAGFCFGYLVYQGLQLGQHIQNFFATDERAIKCAHTSSLILYVISPIFAFYQLFITFKYSNIVISRHVALARFGVMHLIATSLCNWFSTIVEEAVEEYSHKTGNGTMSTTSEFDIASFHIIVQRRDDWEDPFHCTANSVLSKRYLSAIPYLYPFAIEYNLLLAGVWFIVWQNIGAEHTHSNPHHLRHTIQQDELGDQIAYQSNLVINADCHSANKGLFLGIFISFLTSVSVILFFLAMTTKGYEPQAVLIHTGQEGILTIIGLLGVCISYYQIRKLNKSKNPITVLDDALLIVPLPFYFAHGLISIIAEYDTENYIKLGLHILVTLQVVVQTPVIIEGLRRCSNSQSLRYKKPGREVITFLIILNLALWIVNTFELKSVEHYHGQEEYFGDFIWMFISHTTLPLMLFYRFHSSVCLADMWKSAYEKEANL